MPAPDINLFSLSKLTYWFKRKNKIDGELYVHNWQQKQPLGRSRPTYASRTVWHILTYHLSPCLLTDLKPGWFRGERSVSRNLRRLLLPEPFDGRINNKICQRLVFSCVNVRAIWGQISTERFRDTISSDMY